jgi:hypothetical protein
MMRGANGGRISRIARAPWFIPVCFVLAGALIVIMFSVGQRNVEAPAVQNVQAGSALSKASPVGQTSAELRRKATVEPNPATQRAGMPDPAMERTAADSALKAADAAAALAASSQ